MTEVDFFETQPGQVLAGAHRYLCAAKELRDSLTWTERAKLLQAPTIHLLAHGVELLLKYSLLSSGLSPDDVRKQYGHDLVKLWNHDANKVVRPMVLARADEAWEEARVSGRWQADNFDRDPKAELNSALDQLNFLHGRDSGFALRYFVAPNTQAPRPAFLIDVFGEVAERGAKSPRSLTETW
ncbi:hypothetical protein [Rhizobium leguminosarum]|uniref:hypothetical protein n=1 Tax=Rhizobium leguminosarum TaxID=384 RepID=UPI001C9604F7|nr:hypothetical protein [Rhizobium leguminosarum]MBY5405052.1 hypothetical protein [Rhizobium leguminosarum]